MAASLRDPSGAPYSVDDAALGATAERTLCIVLHDVAPPTWGACRALLHEIARVGDFPVTLLAVPRFHGAARDAGFEQWLRERATRGDEVALHGLTHVDDGVPLGAVDRLRRRFYTRGEGEFSALDAPDAAQRIAAGLAWLHELDIIPAGFVAPAWLLGAGAWSALRELPLDYTCTLRRIHLLHLQGPAQALVCQSQVYSSASAWRRQLSVRWNGALAWQQRDAAVVRVELHPGDLAPLVRASWQ
ncbi:MAG TPA: polysaccharide deacetylase family protein, partial [Burkholderiaceae bacterium]